MLSLLISEAHAMAGQAGGAPQGGAGGMFGFIVPMLIVFGIFYFLMIRPQQKQAKKTKEMLDTMRKGDDVVMRCGIFGRVHGIADNVVTLEISDNVRIKVGKEHIGIVKPATEAEVVR